MVLRERPRRCAADPRARADLRDRARRTDAGQLRAVRLRPGRVPPGCRERLVEAQIADAGRYRRAGASAPARTAACSRCARCSSTPTSTAPASRWSSRWARCRHIASAGWRRPRSARRSRAGGRLGRRADHGAGRRRRLAAAALRQLGFEPVGVELQFTSSQRRRGRRRARLPGDVRRPPSLPELKDSILDTIGAHAAGAAVADRRRRCAPAGRQARVVQPGRLDQGPGRRGADRGRRARRQAAARRHDRRADLGQHRHRPGDRRAAEGLPGDRGDAGQDVAREDRPAARLRRRGRGRADRRAAGLAAVLLPRRRPADRRRSRAPSSPTSTPTRPTRRRTTTRPVPSCGSRSASAITHLVVGVGTGGTITGTARYLRERKPDLVVVGADPEGSIYSGGEENVRPYLVEGVGEDFWPQTFDPSVVDRWVTVSDRDAFLTTRRLAQTEGILAGGSGGLALHAALQVAAEVDDPRRDGGRDPRRRPLVPVEDLLRRLDAAVRLPRARRRPDRRRRAAPQARGRRDPVAGHRRAPLPRPRRGGAAARAPRLAAAGGQRRTTRRRSSARSASAACSRHAAAGSVAARRRDRGGDGAAVPAVSSEDPVREAVELLVGDQQALLVTDDGRARGSSPAPTCWRRSPREPIADAPRDAFATRAVHAGLTPDPAFGSVIPAIHQTSTYAQRAAGRVRRGLRLRALGQPDPGGARAGARRARGRPGGRLLLRPGRRARADHRRLRGRARTSCCPADLYGGTYRLVDKVLTPLGPAATTSSTRPTSTRSSGAIRAETRLIWVETPTNPLLNVVDIEAVVARRGDALVAVDNTFATPANQRPLELGADFVVHSTTKYLGGHSDVVGGVGRHRATASSTSSCASSRTRSARCPGPFDCFLVHRGLRTLHLRMAAHARSAAAVVELLRARARGQRRPLARLQRHGQLPPSPRGRGSPPRTALFTLAESLGGVESLIEVPQAMTHQSVEGSPPRCRPTWCASAAGSRIRPTWSPTCGPR